MKTNKKLPLLLITAFILFTIIGTLSHEAGHYFAAKSFGYEAQISYASTHWDDKGTRENINSTFLKHRDEILAKRKFIGSDIFYPILKRYWRNDFYINIWGPLQTILTGTLGFIFLLVYRKSFFFTSRLLLSQWLFIFTSLFWLRQPFNFIIWVFSYFLDDKPSYRMDELKIAEYLRLPLVSIIAFTSLIGITIISFVIFKFIPLPQRKTFIMSGLIGGLLGFILWMYILGPILLP